MKIPFFITTKQFQIIPIRRLFKKILSQKLRLKMPEEVHTEEIAITRDYAHAVAKISKSTSIVWTLPSNIQKMFNRIDAREKAHKEKWTDVIAYGNFVVEYYIGDEDWSMKSHNMWKECGLIICRNSVIEKHVQYSEDSHADSGNRGYGIEPSSHADIYETEEEINIPNLPIFEYNHFTRQNDEYEVLHKTAPDGKPFDFPEWLIYAITGRWIDFIKNCPFIKSEDNRTHHKYFNAAGELIEILDSRKNFSIKAHIDSSVSELFSNTEMLRAVCEYKGYKWLCQQINGKVIDEDIDQYRNPIRLWSGELQMPEYSDHSTMLMKFVDVACPSTKRRYFIPVAPDCRNAWDGVAQTFQMTKKEYKPLKQS